MREPATAPIARLHRARIPTRSQPASQELPACFEPADRVPCYGQASVPKTPRLTEVAFHDGNHAHARSIHEPARPFGVWEEQDQAIQAGPDGEVESGDRLRAKRDARITRAPYFFARHAPLRVSAVLLSNDPPLCKYSNE